MKLSHILVAALVSTSLTLSAGANEKVKKQTAKSKVRTAKQVKPRLVVKPAVPFVKSEPVNKTQNCCPACGRG